MKKFLATLLLGLALTVAALLAAAETSGSPVTLTATDGGASVRLDLPADTVQGVKALRLRFAVESADPVEADFAFDSALPGSVQQYRYDAATGTMTVYVAGGQELLPQGTASLGSIQVDVPAGGTATVHLVENSLELVNGAFGRTEAPAVGNVSVEVSAAETSAPTPTPDPKPTPAPTQTPAEKPTQQNTAGQSGNTQSTQSASNAAPTATPAAPAATAQAPVPSAGSGQTAASGNSGGTKKPAKGSGSASTETQVTPNPTEVPAATATPEPDEQPAVTPAPATPEQAETAAAPAVNLPLAALIAVACLAVVVLIGIAVIRFRSR